jgi:hypothetical protein
MPESLLIRNENVFEPNKKILNHELRSLTNGDYGLIVVHKSGCESSPGIVCPLQVSGIVCVLIFVIGTLRSWPIAALITLDVSSFQSKSIQLEE